jgi:hypothetical protein
MSEVLDTAAPVAPAPASTAAAPAAAPAPAAPATPPAPAPSLLTRAAAPAAPAPAPGADPPAAPAIPEKYLVKNEDGTINHEATALKVSEGYTHLERKLGSADKPPKTPDEYAPELPQGITLDALKTDPLYTGFLKGAHAKGMTNAQLGYVLEQFAARQQMQASPEVAEAELRKEWTTDDDFSRNINQAFRTFKAYGGSEAEAAKLEAKFGSDPDFIRFASRIGKELREDTPAGAALNAAEQVNLEAIYKHPGYFDAKHPEHARLVAQAKAINLKRTGGA